MAASAALSIVLRIHGGYLQSFELDDFRRLVHAHRQIEKTKDFVRASRDATMAEVSARMDGFDPDYVFVQGLVSTYQCIEREQLIALLQRLVRFVPSYVSPVFHRRPRCTDTALVMLGAFTTEISRRLELSCRSRRALVSRRDFRRLPSTSVLESARALLPEIDSPELAALKRALRDL